MSDTFICCSLILAIRAIEDIGDKSEINELQSSIDSLGLEKPMLAEQYVGIDEEMEVRNIEDEEIVSLVNRVLLLKRKMTLKKCSFILLSVLSPL